MAKNRCQTVAGVLCVVFAVLSMIAYYAFRVSWICVLPAFFLTVWVGVAHCCDGKYSAWVTSTLLCFALADLMNALLLSTQQQHAILLLLFRFAGALFWFVLLLLHTDRRDVNLARTITVSVVLTAFSVPMWLLTAHTAYPPHYYIAYNLHATFVCFLFSQTFLARLRAHPDDERATTMAFIAAAALLLGVWASGVVDVWQNQARVWELLHTGFYWTALLCLAVSAVWHKRNTDYVNLEAFDETVIFWN